MTHMVSTLRGEAFSKTRAASPSILARVMGWMEISRQRRALGRLDAAHLRDIGLEDGQAMAEAGRPFWDAPQGWR